MTFKEMAESLDEAEATYQIADYMTERMARTIRGRLRTMPLSYKTHLLLRDLKRELNDYNAKTGSWK